VEFIELFILYENGMFLKEKGNSYGRNIEWIFYKSGDWKRARRYMNGQKLACT
jgi:hypothetical protein